MKTAFIMALIVIAFIATACVQKDIESEQSIQKIVSQTPDLNKPKEEVQKTNTTIVSNITAPEPESETLLISKTCRYSTIVYGGCKWNDNTKTSFNLKIGSAAKVEIPALWLLYTGESGGTKNVKRTEHLVPGGIRTYAINYEDLVKEIGRVTYLEILPVENINGVDYACKNQHVYTIPEEYCKPSSAINVDNMTTGSVS